MLVRLFKSEVLFTLILTLFGFFIVTMSLKLGIGKMKAPGAGFFPFFVGLFMLGVGILLMLGYLTGKRAADLSGAMFSKSELGRYLGMIASFCAWLLFMPWLGFIIMTFLASYAFAKIMGLEGWLRPGVLAFCSSVFIYFLFDVWFYADLPRGILG